MNFGLIKRLAMGMIALCSSTSRAALPDGFIYLDDMAPSIQQDIRYAGTNNFIGRPINGYQAARCILTRQAAEQLAKIQHELAQVGLSLKVWDCYRPKRAVDAFIAWSKDKHDLRNKADYYPSLDKPLLFTKGYIVEKSSHSRGSTVDLTVIATGPHAQTHVPGHILPNRELDMGTHFDWFGVESHTDNQQLPRAVQANRRWFKQLMEQYGFQNLPEEWWHFTLKDEPFPKKYFDFPIT